MNQDNSPFKKVGTTHIHAGHTLFEINHITKEVIPASIEIVDGKKRVMVKSGCEYIAALNLKNAIKKYNKGK